MKLIVISCLQEDKEKAIKIMESCGIAWINMLDTKNYMSGQKPELMDGWFSIEKEYIKTVLLFSLTDSDKANKVIEATELFNAQKEENSYKVNSFVVPIDKWDNWTKQLLSNK